MAAVHSIISEAVDLSFDSGNLYFNYNIMKPSTAVSEEKTITYQKGECHNC
jgi:hypothetical protein